jgi:hypothetical protein
MESDGQWQANPEAPKAKRAILKHDCSCSSDLIQVETCIIQIWNKNAGYSHVDSLRTRTVAATTTLSLSLSV